jgi:hypothetical protein
MPYAMAYPLPSTGKRTDMKKLIDTLANEENYTPAGLLISFLSGVLTGLLCFSIFL